ncbi:MAG TPA: NAD(P)-binding domain-containing protein, partial [Blastocatellia bacterium]|nr:NAD(P)-binding domain-containing protein [Blastocatellia bacterium]
MSNEHSTKRIAIIGGTGDQGKGLALRWAKAGYEIVIGSRAADRAQAAATEMRAQLGADANITGAANADAAADAGIVVLTVPFAAQTPTLKEIKDRLQPQTVLVDVTVPLEPAVGGKPTRVLGVWAGSAAE